MRRDDSAVRVLLLLPWRILTGVCTPTDTPHTSRSPPASGGSPLSLPLATIPPRLAGGDDSGNTALMSTSPFRDLCVVLELAATDAERLPSPSLRKARRTA